MIKMEYMQEPYNYGNVGGQNYKIETKIEMNEDASAGDVLEAVIRLMQTATYHIDVGTLLSFAEEYAYNNGQEDEFNKFINRD